MLVNKRRFLLFVSILTIFTFIYSQSAWAIDLHNLFINPETVKIEKILSQDLPQISYKEFSSFIKISINQLQNQFIFRYEASQNDAVGRPIQYIETQGDAEIVHFGIIFDSIGRVSEEYIKTSAESGSGIFSTEEKSLTQYRYTYDQYGKRDTSYENEIYHEVSSNPLGAIVKAIVAVVTIALTAGMATPLVAAIMAAENFVFNVLSGADIAQAAIGAAISFAASMLGSFLGGADLTSVSQGLTGVDVFIQGLSLADSLMVDDQGRGLFEQVFGKWGSVVFEALSIIVGLKAGSSSYQIYASLGRLAVSAILTAAGDSINPYLRTFISAFTTSFLNAWANAKTYNSNMEAQGFIKQEDGTWIKDEISSRTIVDAKGNKSIEVRDELGNYKYTMKDIFIKEGDKYISIGTDYSDENGIRRLSIFDNGLKIVYNSIGEQYAVIPQGATASFNSRNEIDGSTIAKDNGTVHLDLKGNYTGFTPNGFTAVKAGDKVAYSYQSMTENSFYMVDKDGNNQKLVTQQLDNNYIPVGEYISDEKTIEYYDSRGIKVWDRANKPNSTINLYLENGSKWAEITTNVDKNNLVASYIFENKLTNETSLYDWTGTLDSAIDNTKGDYYQYNEKGETVLYVPKGFDVRRDTTTQQVIDVIGYDDQGNFISQNPEGLRNYRATKENEIYIYDITGKIEVEKLYTVFGEEDKAKFIVFEDILTGNITKYDNKGEYEGDFTPRKDAQGNIIGYKGRDQNGNQAILDKDLNIHSTLTKDGKYTTYIDGEIYRVLRRESVAIVEGQVLDRDPTTGMYSLYTDLGDKITDDPIGVAVNLNADPSELPVEISKEILDNFVFANQEMLASDKSSISAREPTVLEKMGRFFDNVKDRAGNVLITTKDFNVYLAEQLGVGSYEATELAKELFNAVAFFTVLSSRKRFDKLELSDIDRSTQTGPAVYKAEYELKYKSVLFKNVLNEVFVQWIGDKGVPNFDLPGASEVNGKRFEIIFKNGVLNDQSDVEGSRDILQDILKNILKESKISEQVKVGYIHNATNGLCDFGQALTEYFGMTDDTAEFTAYYINERMKDDPNLIMILTDHSQGGLKDNQTWDLIKNQYKDRIYVITNGGAQIAGFPGAAAVINIIKVGDIVPSGTIVKSLLGLTNEYTICLPQDSWTEAYLPVVGLTNHPYGNNYNYMNAQIITKILTRDPNEDFNLIFKDLDYGNH